MTIQNALASIAVKDLKKASLWYEKLLGKPADSQPMPEVAEWHFERGGWLQVYQNQEHAGAGSVTLALNNADNQIATLKQLGISTDNQIDNDIVKLVMIKDPDGNSIAFAQAKKSDMAQ